VGGDKGAPMTSPTEMAPMGDAAPAKRKRPPKDIIKLVGALVGLVLLIAFVLDNSQTVKVGFVFFNARLSLIWVLLIAAFLGAVVDRLVILIGRRRKKRAVQDSL
jgi:uncharacterized integral membrane protein